MVWTLSHDDTGCDSTPPISLGKDRSGRHLRSHDPLAWDGWKPEQ
jgi:hypothetical protein